MALRSSGSEGLPRFSATVEATARASDPPAGTAWIVRRTTSEWRAATCSTSSCALVAALSHDEQHIEQQDETTGDVHSASKAIKRNDMFLEPPWAAMLAVHGRRIEPRARARRAYDARVRIAAYWSPWLAPDAGA